MVYGEPKPRLAALLNGGPRWQSNSPKRQLRSRQNRHLRRQRPIRLLQRTSPRKHLKSQSERPLERRRSQRRRNHRSCRSTPARQARCQKVRTRRKATFVSKRWSGLAISPGCVTSSAQADVAKLVDARDLKSLSLGYAGSIPAVRTRLKSFPCKSCRRHASGRFHGCRQAQGNQQKCPGAASRATLTIGEYPALPFASAGRIWRVTK